MALHAKTMPWSYLSHDAAWTFGDERIIGLVNAIYQGIFVYILADVAQKAEKRKTETNLKV